MKVSSVQLKVFEADTIEEVQTAYDTWRRNLNEEILIEAKMHVQTVGSAVRFFINIFYV